MGYYSGLDEFLDAPDLVDKLFFLVAPGVIGNICRQAIELLFVLCNYGGFRLVHKAAKFSARMMDIEPYANVIALLDGGDFGTQLNALTLLNSLLDNAPDEPKEKKLLKQWNRLGVKTVLLRQTHINDPAFNSQKTRFEAHLEAGGSALSGPKNFQEMQELLYQYEQQQPLVKILQAELLFYRQVLADAQASGAYVSSRAPVMRFDEDELDYEENGIVDLHALGNRGGMKGMEFGDKKKKKRKDTMDPDFVKKHSNRVYEEDVVEKVFEEAEKTRVKTLADDIFNLEIDVSFLDESSKVALGGEEVAALPRGSSDVVEKEKIAEKEKQLKEMLLRMGDIEKASGQDSRLVESLRNQIASLEEEVKLKQDAPLAPRNVQRSDPGVPPSVRRGGPSSPQPDSKAISPKKEPEEAPSSPKNSAQDPAVKEEKASDDTKEAPESSPEEPKAPSEAKDSPKPEAPPSETPSEIPAPPSEDAPPPPAPSSESGPPPPPSEGDPPPPPGAGPPPPPGGGPPPPPGGGPPPPPGGGPPPPPGGGPPPPPGGGPPPPGGGPPPPPGGGPPPPPGGGPPPPPGGGPPPPPGGPPPPPGGGPPPPPGGGPPPPPGGGPPPPPGGGPPPPPGGGGPPPPGGMMPRMGGNFSVIRPAVKPKAKMKPFHWGKIVIKPTSKQSVWNGLQNDLDFDTDLLEEMFSVKKNTKLGMKGPAKKEDGTPPEQAILRILAPKRSNAIGIMSSRMPSVDKILLAVKQMDNSVLSLEDILALLNNFPTSEEVMSIKELSAADGKLDAPERFCMQIAADPDTKNRLQCWKFQLCFNELLEDVQVPLFGIEEACKQLQKSKKLKTILVFFLEIGNYLNGGSARGQADGFEIKNLSKLSDTKDVTNTVTLLEHGINQMKKKAPELLTFSEELSRIPKASQISFTTTAENLRKLILEMKDVRADVLRLKEGKDDSDIAEDPFLREMPKFADKATQKVLQARDLLADVEKLFRETLDFFAVNTKKDNLTTEEFFGIFNLFMEAFKKIAAKRPPKKRTGVSTKGKKVGGDKNNADPMASVINAIVAGKMDNAKKALAPPRADGEVTPPPPQQKKPLPGSGGINNSDGAGMDKKSSSTNPFAQVKLRSKSFGEGEAPKLKSKIPSAEKEKGGEEKGGSSPFKVQLRKTGSKLSFDRSPSSNTKDGSTPPPEKEEGSKFKVKLNRRRSQGDEGESSSSGGKSNIIPAPLGDKGGSGSEAAEPDMSISFS